MAVDMSTIAKAAGSRFRAESRLEAVARCWPRSGLFGRLRRLLKRPFETLVAWRTGSALESRLPGGEIVRVLPGWRHLSWNPDEYAAFREATHVGDVVIDAGANGGSYALLFGQWVGPSGRVYAFEPDPRAFAALVDHVALNGLGERVFPVRAAVGETSGHARLHLASASGLSRVLSTGVDGEPVDVVSIDDFCARLNITPRVIKIDVEGSELQVLRGARRTVAAAAPCIGVFVEMHPSIWRDMGITANDIVRECEASALTPERLDGSRERLWEIEGVCLRLRSACAGR